MKIPSLVVCLGLMQVVALAQTSQKSTGTNQLTSDQDQNLRAYIELLRTDLKKSKTQVMAEVMQLDADQASKFWPIYKDFERELATIGNSIVKLVENYVANYATMTPETADQIANDLLDIEGRRLNLKKNYYGRVKAALDPITAARFLQVENQLEKLIDLQLASQLPVMN